MNCTILQGDALELLRTLPPESVHTCVTSPPYYNLRDYGVEGQIGNEGSVDEHPQFLRTHSKARTAGVQEKRPDRHTLAVGICPPRRRLVFAARHHLAEAELYAGERK